MRTAIQSKFMNLQYAHTRRIHPADIFFLLLFWLTVYSMHHIMEIRLYFCSSFLFFIIEFLPFQTQYKPQFKIAKKKNPLMFGILCFIFIIVGRQFCDL